MMYLCSYSGLFTVCFMDNASVKFGSNAAGAQQKLQDDGEQLTGCTFAPKTGRAPKQDLSPKKPFPERLYRRRDAKYAQVKAFIDSHSQMCAGSGL